MRQSGGPRMCIFLAKNTVFFIGNTGYMAFFEIAAAVAASTGGLKIGIYSQSRYNAIKGCMA